MQFINVGQRDVANALFFHYFFNFFDRFWGLGKDYQPRSVLRSVFGGAVKELERHGRESFCCGAGGGRMWMEETIGKRINIERTEEIVDQNASTAVVGCPFCLTMIEDGMKEMEKEETITTMDIAEIVEKNMVW